MSNSGAFSPRIRCVVFDLDGLLIDTEPIFEEAIRRLLQRRGLPLGPGVMREMMGTPAVQSLLFLKEHYNLKPGVPELIAERTVIFDEILEERPAKLMAGALELLGRLKASGLPRAIATSSTAAYVRRVLASHPQLQQFEFILTCEDVTRGKPFPEVYEKAADRFGSPPREMLVLEDSPNGLRAAKAAGARCVVIPHPLVPPDAITQADAILERLDSPGLYKLLGW